MGPYINKPVLLKITASQLVDSIQLVEKLTNDQWKQDTPELNFEWHGCEYLLILAYTFYLFIFWLFQFK